MGVVIICALVALVILFIWIRPYLIKYDTVVAFTGGLGTGKSFMSVETAIRELRKNRLKTAIYNILRFIKRKPKLDKPLLYSSIPIRISKREMSVKLTSDMLTLQEGFVKGSIVFIDEIDVFANQFAYANHNIIEISSKKDLNSIRAGVLDYDSGLFDEEIRLFRHLYSSSACECKLICNSQATSNITTIVRRRMNTVFVLSKFRKYKLPILSWLLVPYSVEVRNITITDEITNTSDKNAEDSMRIHIGFMPRIKHYDTHCYSGRADTIPVKYPIRWCKLKTQRLLKSPIDYRKNQSKKEDD